jgi:hypothetical protein
MDYLIKYPMNNIINKYTVVCRFTGDRNFDSERSSILWELGTHSLSFSYPNMNFIIGNIRWNISLDGVGVKGYYYYKNNHDITIMTIYDADLSKITIYVDGYLLAEKSAVLPSINKSLEVKTLTGASYDKFSGNISLISLSNTADYIEPKPELGLKLRYNDYPIGYNPNNPSYDHVKSAIGQLEAFVAPNLKDSNPTASCVNLLYLGGYGQPGVSKEAAINNAVSLQTVLTNKFNWEIRVVDSLNVFYSERNLPTNQSLSLSLIELAKRLPATLSVGSSWAHLDEINGLKKCNLNTLNPSSPNSDLDNDREIYKIMSQALLEKLSGLKISRHYENDEYITGYAETIGFAKTAEFVNYVLAGLRNVLTPTESIEYDVHSPWFYSNKVFDFKNRISINTNRMGTCQFYPRYPWNWREWFSADRGINFYMNSKIQELKDGCPLNTPYICFGWDKREENNIRPAQALGLAKILKVAGSSYFFSAYFTIGSSGIQDPRGYVWQQAVPAYVEESVVNYKYIIENGTLLEGDVLYNWYNNGNAIPQYNFKTGDKSIYCIVRNLGDEYLIASTYQCLNNYQGQDNSKMFSITLEGKVLSMNGRRQGSVYYYNKVTGKLKMLDSSHKQTHFERWALS